MRYFEKFRVQPLGCPTAALRSFGCTLLAWTLNGKQNPTKLLLTCLALIRRKIYLYQRLWAFLFEPFENFSFFFSRFRQLIILRNRSNGQFILRFIFLRCLERVNGAYRSPPEVAALLLAADERCGFGQILAQQGKLNQILCHKAFVPIFARRIVGNFASESVFF